MLLDGVRVDAEGDRRVSMTQSGRFGHRIETGGDRLRRREVAEGVKLGVDAGSVGDAETLD